MRKIPDILKEKAIGFVFNVVSLVVTVTIILLVLYAFAAFTEPSSAPDASNQDFSQNILGADNADNLFSSTNVASNADGSIIERLEELRQKAVGTADVGSMTGSITGSVPEMIKYLYDRVAGTTDIGAVTGSITGSLPEMTKYLWDNRTSFGASNGLRQYYLTTGTYNGSQTLTACAAGYHMANFFEIFDISNLRYNTSLGYTAADSGYGPPVMGGWVRTGYPSDGSGAGANCNVWTDSGTVNGTYVSLYGNWTTSTGGSIEPWIAYAFPCSTVFGVWCVQDY